MAEKESTLIKSRIETIKRLADKEQGMSEFFEAGALALTTLHDIVGGSHPLASILSAALKAQDWAVAGSASRAVITLYEQGGLQSPRLAIAHEIEGNILDIAQAQVQAAERNDDAAQRQLQLAIAAFLAGASLEDALRRLCDSSGIPYDVERTTISKLQASLYQPAKQIEVISSSENKQITSWGDTRNKADHGKFRDITFAEVLSIVVGVRAFIDNHLP